VIWRQKRKKQNPLSHLLTLHNEHALAIFSLDGHLLRANPKFSLLCPGVEQSAHRLNLFQDFILSAEALARIQSNHFVSCLALYAPLDPFSGNRESISKNLEMILIPYRSLNQIVACIQPLKAWQQGVMIMEDLDTYQFITDKFDDIVFLQDQNFRIVYANKSAFSLLGFEPQELFHHQSLLPYHPEDRAEVSAAMQKLAQETGEICFEARMRHHDGHYIWIESRGKVFYSNGLRIILTINRDITQRKQTEEQIRFMTFHDSLTGLYNRHYFEQEMNRMADGRYTAVGLIICDVDCLKFINDTLGHQRGDQLIKAAGETILNSFRISDMVARIGGDEFAVLLPNATRKDLIHAARRIKKNMNHYRTQHPELPLHLSIGYAQAQSSPFDMHSLFKHADDAMYRNKLYNKKRHKSDAFQILLSILYHHDPEAAGRQQQLEEKIRKMIQFLEISEQESTFLLLFAKVYNIGLLGVPREITAKRTPLSAEEQALLRKQAECGYRIAQHLKELQPIAEWIYKQHEWWNGQGYPLGLQGDSIPLPSRIMAVARAYTAMTTPRPPHQAKSHDQALAELRKWAGTQFDPHLVDVFSQLPNNSSEKKQFSSRYFSPCSISCSTLHTSFRPHR
jgi:diguanylate cyclase (GGDEF)-like protein/PAS domain S-box-containing protein